MFIPTFFAAYDLCLAIIMLLVGLLAAGINDY